MEVTVTDMRTEEALGTRLAELPEGVGLILGRHPVEAFTGADLVVLSPGVPVSLSAVQAAIDAGVEVIGELELAYRAMPEVPYYAVAGTNGKSTTTTLLHLMLEAAGMRSLIAGNIGNALSEEIVRIGEDARPQCVVVEVSSFQLEAISKFRAHGAALLNVTPDHLDRYGSIESYGATKFNVFMNQTAEDFAVLNADDPLSMALYDARKASMRGKVFFFSRRGAVKGVFAERDSVSFDMDGRGLVIDTSEIAIPGVHNLENAMAASAMACAAGVKPDAIASVLRTFAGLEHRMEFVREVGGVRYINDSKGTNVDAAIKSVEGFKEPVILIAGGRDKAGDFDAFARSVGKRLKAIILIGEAKGKLRRAFEGKTKCVDAGALDEAVALARSMASPGDVVLLSPACASFDMFRDFEDRGRQFKRIVGAL